MQDYGWRWLWAVESHSERNAALLAGGLVRGLVREFLQQRKAVHGKIHRLWRRSCQTKHRQTIWAWFIWFLNHIYAAAARRIQSIVPELYSWIIYCISVNEECVMTPCLMFSSRNSFGCVAHRTSFWWAPSSASPDRWSEHWCVPSVPRRGMRSAPVPPAEDKPEPSVRSPSAPFHWGSCRRHHRTTTETCCSSGAFLVFVCLCGCWLSLKQMVLYLTQKV